jgi:outer membrane receptor for ferrienterochelin and colicins
MILNSKYFCIYFSLLFGSFLQGQETKGAKKDSVTVERLDEVLITATRTLRQLSSLPLPAQIISKKQIKAVNSLRLSDILEEQTGLISVPDFGGGEGIQMQGLDSQYILILIDGVPLVGRSAGTLDLNRISVGNIKQIEIIKGASSSLYGNEALGGVINIITERPISGFTGDLNYRSSSFNTQDIGTNINYKNTKFGVTAFFNRNSSDGYDLVAGNATNTVDPFVNYTASANMSYEFSEKTKLITSTRYYNQIQDNILSENLSGESEINEWNINLRLEHEFNAKWKSYLELYGTQYKAEEFFSSAISDETTQSDFNQRFLRPELRTTYALNATNELISGIGLTNERLDRTLFSTTPEFNSPYIYAQYDGTISEKLNVILGARFDAHNVYESQFSPKAALRYQISDKISIKGSAGYGFKAPDFRQLFLDFSNSTVGYTVIGYNEAPRRLQELFEQDQLNIDTNIYPTQADQQGFVNAIVAQFDDNLRAESSVSFNLGLDLKPTENVKLNINAFRNTISNLIETQAIAQRQNGQNVFSYTNLAEVYTQGIEFDTRWKVNNKLTISGGYQLLYAFDEEAKTAFENDEVFARDPQTLQTFRLDEDHYFGLFNRSRHTANFKIFYDIPKWGLNTNIRAVYRSKFGLFDTNGNTYLDDFDTFVAANTIWDFAINKTLFEKYKLGIGIDNLFDFTDTQITNVPGRLFYATLNINF